MGKDTKIEWTKDGSTWNPVTGCDQVSPGCDNCYAKTVAEDPRNRSHYPNLFAVTLRPEALNLPLRWKTPRMIFVNSMSDLFHASISDEYIAKVFAVMALSPQHTFQVLTKRHARMRSLLNSSEFHRMVRGLVLTASDWLIPGVCVMCRHTKARHTKAGRCQGKSCPCGSWSWSWAVPASSWPLPNVWLGVSVENQKWADLRIPALQSTPAVVRFLSCEPLLGAVDLTPFMTPRPYEDSRETEDWGIHWVIVGGESGKEAKPMHPRWAQVLRDQCVESDTPFFFKQWGEWAPPSDALHFERPRTEGGMGKTPQGGHRSIYLDEAGEVRSTNELKRFVLPDNWANLARVGKRNAGRMLDGKLWDEYPQPD